MKFAEFPLFNFDYEVYEYEEWSATILKDGAELTDVVLAQDVIILETEAEIRLSSSITVVYRHAQNKLIISSKDL